MTMSEIVRKLRADGWRVRDGDVPMTRAAYARWDFYRSKTTLSANMDKPEAQAALNVLLKREAGAGP